MTMPSRGGYFVTICTLERELLFGKIVDDIVRLSAFGEIVEACWNLLPHHYPHVLLDAFVIMPNHVHGIIFLLDENVGLAHLQLDASSNVGAGLTLSSELSARWGGYGG